MERMFTVDGPDARADLGMIKVCPLIRPSSLVSFEGLLMKALNAAKSMRKL